MDGLTVPLDIDIVSDHYTGHNLILGGELSDYVEVRIRRRKATLKKIEENTADAATKGCDDEGVRR